MVVTRYVSLVVALCCATVARTENLNFPLHVGDQWIYRCRGNCGEDTATVKVLQTSILEPQQEVYFLLRGFGKETWVRISNGRLLAHDAEAKQDKPWYEFDVPEGQEYSTSIHPCNPSARIASRKDSYQGPAGQFDTALRIAYTSTCDYAGLFSETFVPGIGLMQRRDTATGETTYDLIYARLGGINVISQPELSFGLSLDRSAYGAGVPGAGQAPPQMTARITLRNTSDPIQLTFPTSQIYDLVLRDEDRKIIYQWSADKSFASASITQTFESGETNFVIVVPLAGPDGNALAPGRYGAEAWLTAADNDPSRNAFAASVGFEIRSLQ